MNRNIGILFLVLVAVAASVLVAENYPSNYISKDDVGFLTGLCAGPGDGPDQPNFRQFHKYSSGIIMDTNG